MSWAVPVAGCQHCSAQTVCGSDFLCRISEPYAAIRRHIETRWGRSAVPTAGRLGACLGKFGGGIPPASVHRGRTALRMALISGVALSLLAGSALPADAAAGMRFYSTGGWFMGGMNVPVRRHRATTVKREKSEPKKETGFGEMPKGPLQLVVSINTQKVTLFSNGVRIAQGSVST